MVLHAIPIITIGALYTVSWLNFGTFALFTVLSSVLLFYAAIRTGFRTAQVQLNMVCMDLDTVATQIVKTQQILPEYIAKSNQAMVENIHRQLLVIVATLEKLVIWAVGMYKTLVQCFLGLAIDGILEVVTMITAPVQQVAETVWQGANSVGNHLEHWVGGNSSSSNPATLGNWTNAMTEIQAKVQSWTSGNELHMLVDKPFEELRYQINQSAMTIFRRVPPTLPSAAVETPVCDPTSLTKAILQAEAQLLQLTYILIGVLAGAFLLCTILNALYIRFRHRSLERQSSHLLSSNAIVADNHRGARQIYREDLQYFSHTSTKPIVSSILRTHSVPSSNSSGSRTLWWWSVDFLTHPMILYCLGVALCGLVTIYLLLWNTHRLMDSVNFSEKAYSWAHTTSGDLLAKATAQVQAQTALVNHWITETEIQLNNHTFHSVRLTADALNTTLTQFVDNVEDFIHITLGNTFLENPAKDVLGCLFLSKIQSMNEGLTWMVHNSYVNLSRVHMMDLDMWSGPQLEKKIASTFDRFWLDIQQNLDSHLRAHLKVYWILFSFWLVCLVITLIFMVFSAFSGRNKKNTKVTHAITTSMAEGIKTI
ncbi:plasma membrane fusion protein prm1 [Apophysomyces sp. BC1015]|nr:plasma membrane fusion protein prm1 [Apophysomyces sp. BC1015]